MRTSRLPFLLGVVIAVATATAVAATATAGFAIPASVATPVKIENCSKLVSRPQQVTLACGDGNIFLKGLRWTSFGGSTAHGNGAFVTNSCEPNCAAGKDVSFPVKIKLSRPVSCKGRGRAYGKLQLQFTGRAPGPGVPRTFNLGCTA